MATGTKHGLIRYIIDAVEPSWKTAEDLVNDRIPYTLQHWRDVFGLGGFPGCTRYQVIAFVLTADEADGGYGLSQREASDLIDIRQPTYCEHLGKVRRYLTRHAPEVPMPEGRTCARQDCSTVLSTFNRSDRCALHGRRTHRGHPLADRVREACRRPREPLSPRAREVLDLVESMATPFFVDSPEDVFYRRSLPKGGSLEDQYVASVRGTWREVDHALNKVADLQNKSDGAGLLRFDCDDGWPDEKWMPCDLDRLWYALDCAAGLRGYLSLSPIKGRGEWRTHHEVADYSTLVRDAHPAQDHPGLLEWKRNYWRAKYPPRIASASPSASSLLPGGLTETLLEIAS